MCELQAFTGTLILCAMFRIYWTFMFFCFSKNPDGGLQKQTRPPQRHSDQRDSDQAPQQHPPQPPTRQLPDNGEQENSAPTAGFSTVFTPLLTHILRRQPLVHLLFFSLRCSQVVPKSHKYFSLPAGKSLDSKFSVGRRSYAGKIPKLLP